MFTAASKVQVPVPELALNMAVCVDVGTPAPPAPPLVADQLAEVFQFPFPAIQYLSLAVEKLQFKLLPELKQLLVAAIALPPVAFESIASA